MEKFLVTFEMVNGKREVFEIERESYSHIAFEVTNPDRWFGIKVTLRSGFLFCLGGGWKRD